MAPKAPASFDTFCGDNFGPDSLNREEALQLVHFLRSVSEKDDANVDPAVATALESIRGDFDTRLKTLCDAAVATESRARVMANVIQAQVRATILPAAPAQAVDVTASIFDDEEDPAYLAAIGADTDVDLTHVASESFITELAENLLGEDLESDANDHKKAELILQYLDHPPEQVGEDVMMVLTSGHALEFIQRVVEMSGVDSSDIDLFTAKVQRYMQCVQKILQRK